MRRQWRGWIRGEWKGRRACLQVRRHRPIALRTEAEIRSQLISILVLDARGLSHWRAVGWILHAGHGQTSRYLCMAGARPSFLVRRPRFVGGRCGPGEVARRCSSRTWACARHRRASIARRGLPGERGRMSLRVVFIAIELLQIVRRVRRSERQRLLILSLKHWIWCILELLRSCHCWRKYW